jgi:hypothetical protein
MTDAVYEDLKRKYASARTQEALLQSAAHAHAALAGSSAPSYKGIESAPIEAEIEEYLRSKRVPKTTKAYKETTKVVKGTDIPVVQSEGKYWYTNPNSGELEQAKSVVDRKKYGTGSGKAGSKKGHKATSGMIDRLAGFKAFNAQASDIQGMLDDPELRTDVYKKAWEGAKDFTMPLGVGEVDPKYTEYSAATSGLMAEYRKLMSGTAVSEREMEALAQELPQPGTPKEKAKEQLKRFKNKTKLLFDKYKDTIGGFGVDVSKVSLDNPPTNFPMTLRERKSGDVVEVINEQELQEALSEGWEP